MTTIAEKIQELNFLQNYILLVFTLTSLTCALLIGHTKFINFKMVNCQWEFIVYLFLDYTIRQGKPMQQRGGVRVNKFNLHKRNGFEMLKYSVQKFLLSLFSSQIIIEWQCCCRCASRTASQSRIIFQLIEYNLIIFGNFK